MEIINCACGCGDKRDSTDSRGRTRKYISGHQNKDKSKAQIRAAIKTLNASRPKVPWNKGKSYVIGKRIEYANKGAWNMAMRRMYPNVCMRCGWKQAPCDTHHIVLKSNGGKYTLENGVILCPNCHRLTHCGIVTTEELRAIKAASIVIGVTV